jgi:hypothetical protein
MSTQQTAQVYVTNTTDGQATITLYHAESVRTKALAARTKRAATPAPRSRGA